MPAMRKQLILLGLVVLLSAAALVAGDKTSKSKRADASSSASAAPMEDDKRIVHALNRFTFGIRPGDVERVRAMGLDKWFDEQLHPDKINDGALEARIAPFRTLKMSTREMVENFPDNQVLKAVQNGKMSMPRDSAKKAIYESRMVAMEERQQKKADAGTGDAKPATTPLASSANTGSTKSASDMNMNADTDAANGQSKSSQKQAEDAM